MSVRLFASGPCTINIGGKPTHLQAGDRITVSKLDADNALNSYAKSRLVVVSETVEEEQPKVEQSSYVNIETPVLGLETKIDSEEPYVLPFALNSHWRVVVNYLRAKEETNEVDYEEVKYIKLKFKEYSSVQKECDRLLSQALKQPKVEEVAELSAEPKVYVEENVQLV